MPQPDLTVQMIGILYFGVCGPNSNRVLAPNGIRSDGHMPPHFSSIFVEEDQYDTDDWWPTDRIERPVSVPGGTKPVTLIEFRIPEQSVVRFPDGRTNAPDLGNLEGGLLRMRDIDPTFRADFSPAGNWIAQIELRGGALQAFTLNGNVSAVQWKMSTDGPLRITATPNAGPTRSITLRRKSAPLGSEVVFANAPDLLAMAAREPRHMPHFAAGPTRENPLGHRHTRDEVHHFKLYGKIKLVGDDSKLVLPNHRQGIPGEHIMMKVLDDVALAAGCSSTCCAKFP